MKIVLKLFLLIALLGFSGCEDQAGSAEVRGYIDQLIAGTYESWELPEFSPSDISDLLKYRNETTIITNFPRNGISSFYQQECKLGMFVLWTIESIRAVETSSEYLIGRFPSQNPVLAIRDEAELHMVFDDQSHKEAARAYKDWWNSFYPGKNKISIDPLEKTKYRWH